jgi:phage terminase large subunit
MLDLHADESVRFLPPDGPDAEWPEVGVWNTKDWAHWLRQHNRFPFLRQWSEEEIQQYLFVDRYRYGLGFGTSRDQADEDKEWFYLPTPVAVPFHASKVRNILFGGAAGGSKSYSIRYDAYRHAFAVPRFKAILMRRTFEELERNHITDIRSEVTRFNNFFNKSVIDYNEKRHEIIVDCHGGGHESHIVLGHCQNVGDEEKYLGPAYDAFYPDEMATFEKKQIIGVAGRLRSEKPGVVPRLAGGSNPGGAHTLWLKRWFIEKNEAQIRQTEHPKYRADRYHFIPAMLYDNPYYMDPDGTYTDYEERLYAYDPERRKQLLAGDWDALTGQFFPEFNDKSTYGHVHTLVIPAGCKVERWIDWGYSPHYGMCLWVAIFPNGRLYVFYEWRFNGEQARQKLVASEVAQKIRAYTVDEVLPLVRSSRIRQTIADPHMSSGDGHSGEDYAETFRRNGVPLTMGDNERVMGWGRLRHWFRRAPDGYPWMLFHPRCVTCIRTIPGLVRDEKDPDDVDTSQEDHAADALRYGVMARPTPVKLKESLPLLVEGTPAELMKTIAQSGKARQVGMVS